MSFRCFAEFCVDNVSRGLIQLARESCANAPLDFSQDANLPRFIGSNASIHGIDLDGALAPYQGRLAPQERKNKRRASAFPKLFFESSNFRHRAAPSWS